VVEDLVLAAACGEFLVGLVLMHLSAFVLDLIWLDAHMKFVWHLLLVAVHSTMVLVDVSLL
jgi:hypothetical protein